MKVITTTVVLTITVIQLLDHNLFSNAASVSNDINLAYRGTWTHEPTECPDPIYVPEPTPCTPTHNRSILIARMFAHEVDTLEIVLAENEGLADVMVVENLRTHNVQAIDKPYYLWNELRHGDRFKKFEQSVLFRQCESKKDKKGMWDAEWDDNDCLSNFVDEVKKEYDIIVVGSVDEMLSRENIYKLKYCDNLPALPAPSAISTGFGLLSRSCTTDWSARGTGSHDFILPTTYPASDTRFDRQFTLRKPNPPIVGGVHLTNYCFLPNMLLKTIWATEYKGTIDHAQFCKKTLMAHKTECLQSIVAKKHCQPPGSEYAVPRLIAQCPDRFPAWEGKIDPREEYVYKMMCAGRVEVLES